MAALRRADGSTMIRTQWLWACYGCTFILYIVELRFFCCTSAAERIRSLCITIIITQLGSLTGFVIVTFHVIIRHRYDNIFAGNGALLLVLYWDGWWVFDFTDRKGWTKNSNTFRGINMFFADRVYFCGFRIFT